MDADEFILTGTGEPFDEIESQSKVFASRTTSIPLDPDNKEEWHMYASKLLKTADQVLLFWDGEETKLKLLRTVCELKHIPYTIVWTVPKQW